MEGVHSLNDEVLSTRDPTLVFHEKPSLGSSGREAVLTNQTAINQSSSDERMTNGTVNFLGSKRENIVKVEHDGEGSSNHDESSLFSFKPGIQKLGPEKVIFLFCEHMLMFELDFAGWFSLLMHCSLLWYFYG